MSPHASPIAVHRNRVFVVNTPSDTVDVIDTRTRKIVKRIPVGIDLLSQRLQILDQFFGQTFPIEMIQSVTTNQITRLCSKLWDFQK